MARRPPRAGHKFECLRRNQQPMKKTLRPTPSVPLLHRQTVRHVKRTSPRVTFVQFVTLTFIRTIRLCVCNVTPVTNGFTAGVAEYRILTFREYPPPLTTGIVPAVSVLGCLISCLQLPSRPHGVSSLVKLCMKPSPEFSSQFPPFVLSFLNCPLEVRVNSL